MIQFQEVDLRQILVRFQYELSDFEMTENYIDILYTPLVKNQYNF